MTSTQPLPGYRGDGEPLTTLYVNYWTPPTAERRREIDECLQRNIDCRAIDRIVLLTEHDSDLEHRRTAPASPKIRWVDLPARSGRVRYADFVDAANRYTTTPWDFNIIANSDVFFDDSLEVLRPLDLFGTCIALSRWEWKNGRAESLAGDNSQDCWIFQGPIRPLADGSDFEIGRFGCDWHFAWVLRHNDYTLLNTPYDVRHYHIHDSSYRDNGVMTPGPYVQHVPYRRLEDCRLPEGRSDRGGLLAYSLWGDSTQYNAGAVENAKLAKWVYPDWTVRVYVDRSTPAETTDALTKAGADVVAAPVWPGWHGGLFWRLLAADETAYVRWGVRDADSRLIYRERQAVDAWIESGYPLHTIRDHPNHRRPVMLCGFDGRRGAITDMAGVISAWRNSGNPDTYGSDEEMIAQRVWPSIRDRTLVHSDFHDPHGHGGVIRPFPTRFAEGMRFVGERIYEDNHHHGDDRDDYVAARLAASPRRVATRDDLLKLVPRGSVIAEIGVFRGEFAARILDICRPSELHLIDLWTSTATSGDKDGRNIVTVEDMELMYLELRDRYRRSPQVHLHRGDSRQILAGFPERSLDAAYLDSSHDYHSTLAELDLLSRKVRPGGWLMGHDYLPGCPVWPAVNDWCCRMKHRISWLTEHDGCPSFGIMITAPASP